MSNVLHVFNVSQKTLREIQKAKEYNAFGTSYLILTSWRQASTWFTISRRWAESCLRRPSMLVGELEMKSWKLMERRYGVSRRPASYHGLMLASYVCWFVVMSYLIMFAGLVRSFPEKNKRAFHLWVVVFLSHKSGSSQVRSNRAIQNAVRRVVAQKKLPVNFKVRRWAVPDGSRGMIQLTNKGRSLGWYSKSW